MIGQNSWKKTLAKLEAYKAHLVQGEGFDYMAQDASEFLNAHDHENAVFIAPPTFGSNDYVKQERMLAASADWTPPPYTEISFKDTAIYEQITAFREWMIIMERPLPEIEKLLGDPVGRSPQGAQKHHLRLCRPQQKDHSYQKLSRFPFAWANFSL